MVILVVAGVLFTGVSLDSSVSRTMDGQSILISITHGNSIAMGEWPVASWWESELYF